MVQGAQETQLCVPCGIHDRKRLPHGHRETCPFRYCRCEDCRRYKSGPSKQVTPESSLFSLDFNKLFQDIADPPKQDPPEPEKEPPPDPEPATSEDSSCVEPEKWVRRSTRARAPVRQMYNPVQEPRKPKTRRSSGVTLASRRRGGRRGKGSLPNLKDEVKDEIPSSPIAETFRDIFDFSLLESQPLVKKELDPLDFMSIEDEIRQIAAFTEQPDEFLLKEEELETGPPPTRGRGGRARGRSRGRGGGKIDSPTDFSYEMLVKQEQYPFGSPRARGRGGRGRARGRGSRGRGRGKIATPTDFGCETLVKPEPYPFDAKRGRGKKRGRPRKNMLYSHLESTPRVSSEENNRHSDASLFLCPESPVPLHRNPFHLSGNQNQNLLQEQLLPPDFPEPSFHYAAYKSTGINAYDDTDSKISRNARPTVVFCKPEEQQPCSSGVLCSERQHPAPGLGSLQNEAVAFEQFLDLCRMFPIFHEKSVKAVFDCCRHNYQTTELVLRKILSGGRVLLTRRVQGENYPQKVSLRMLVDNSSTSSKANGLLPISEKACIVNDTASSCDNSEISDDQKICLDSGFAIISRAIIDALQVLFSDDAVL